MLKGMNGMVTGMILGIGVASMVLPQMDRKKQRAVRKFSKRVMNRAMNSYDGIVGLMD